MATVTNQTIGRRPSYRRRRNRRLAERSDEGIALAGRYGVSTMGATPDPRREGPN